MDNIIKTAKNLDIIKDENQNEFIFDEDTFNWSNDFIWKF